MTFPSVRVGATFGLESLTVVMEDMIEGLCWKVTSSSDELEEDQDQDWRQERKSEWSDSSEKERDLE